MSCRAQVRYLEVSQANYTKQESSYACVTISLYSSVFLTYSKEPTVPGLLQWFRFAAQQWDTAVAHKHALVRCEIVDAAYDRYADVKTLLECSETYLGISIKGSKEDREFGGTKVYGSVLSALKEVEKRVRPLPLHKSIAFTFTCGLYTLGGIVRSLGENLGVIIHFIDSHNRIIPFAAPPAGLPQGSAVWVTADSAQEAAQCIEAIYPPCDQSAEEGDDVYKSMESVPRDMTSLARQKAGESRLIPPGQFELRTFVPRYATPAQASAAAQSIRQQPPDARRL